MLEAQNKIDFVVTWVDGSDPVWLEEKEKHIRNINTILNGNSRYRDWDIFKFWFRAVEKYAPWVNKIFLITEGHLPTWINLNHPKLVHIKHKDYIDEKYLPTFNSNVIEMNIHNIEGLSEKFVLFNDDTFINSPVEQKDFFDGNYPKDVGVFSPIVPNFGGIASIVLNNLEIINKYFSFRDVVKNNFFKFYNLKYNKHLLKNICVSPWKTILGFYDVHIPISYSKSYFRKISELESSIFSETYSHKFREKKDINHWLIRYWQLCDGYFSPRNIKFGSYYNILDQLDLSLNDITNSISKIVCLNDGESVDNFLYAKSMLGITFEKKFPQKSKFEL
ncbi:Stealth CR1 domain-containing protein [Rodentibacter ratti]|uniref:Stealth CR1 domain-containing protein n=1 Tax=Rodentibacter ratti TaxID=1906745 RepID=UPI0009846FC8|nr:Stealth CR1 domain-containing protein [Rodentibacter ratti]